MTAGCAEIGDFGRPRERDFDWNFSSSTAAQAGDAAAAQIVPLTDDEKLLRDLAFALIMPPYDRSRWNQALADQINRNNAAQRTATEPSAYANNLLETPYRSATARYARLIEDIRNDVVRISPFVLIARRVTDIDRKREKSFAYVSSLAEVERAGAMGRMVENAAVIDWVRASLAERTISYRYALERLVIATPTPLAVEVERALVDLTTRTEREFGPGVEFSEAAQ